MKRAQVVFILKTVLAFGLVAAFESLAQQKQEILDNQAIIAMVKAHLSTENIVTKIEMSPGRYNVTTAAIVQLSQVGVPKEVIAAMQAEAYAQQNRTGPTSHPAPKLDRVTAPIPGRWQIHDSVDPMTDLQVKYAEVSVSGDPSGKFTVKATCSDDSMLNFVFINKSKDQALLRSHQSLCVDMKLRVVESEDNRGDAKDITSQYCELPNVAVVNFIGNSATLSRRSADQTESALKAMLAVSPPPQMAHPEELPGIGKALDGMLRDLSERSTEATLNVAGVPRMRDVIGASSMRVGFPFTDGTFSVIRLDLQQFEFQNYVRSCVTGETERDLPGDKAADFRAASSPPSDVSPPSAAVPSSSNRPWTELDRKLHGAWQYAQAQDWNHALTAYSAVLAEAPSNPDAIAGIKAIQAIQDHHEQLMAQFQQAGVWWDAKFGKLWTARDNGRDLGWDSAQQYCNSMNKAGSNDWKLPSTVELQWLGDGNSYSAHIALTTSAVWTRDFFQLPSSYYFYDFNSHRLAWGRKTDGHRALCVSIAPADLPFNLPDPVWNIH